MSRFQQHMSAMQQFNPGRERQFTGDTLEIDYVVEPGRHIVCAFPDYNDGSSSHNTLQPSFEKETWEITL